MIVTKKALPRRTFLRGLGTTLALPLLDGMVPAPSNARRSGTVITVTKITPTPAAYPRRPGVPSRKPL